MQLLQEQDKCKWQNQNSEPWHNKEMTKEEIKVLCEQTRELTHDLLDYV